MIRFNLLPISLLFPLLRFCGLGGGCEKGRGSLQFLKLWEMCDASNPILMSSLVMKSFLNRIL